MRIFHCLLLIPCNTQNNYYKVQIFPHPFTPLLRIKCCACDRVACFQSHHTTQGYSSFWPLRRLPLASSPTSLTSLSLPIMPSSSSTELLTGSLSLLWTNFTTNQKKKVNNWGENYKFNSRYLPFLFWIGGSETALSCLGGAGLYPLLTLPRSLSPDQSLFFLNSDMRSNNYLVHPIPDNFIMQGTARANVVASIGFGLFLPANNQLSITSPLCLSHLGT